MEVTEVTILTVAMEDIDIDLQPFILHKYIFLFSVCCIYNPKRRIAIKINYKSSFGFNKSLYAQCWSEILLMVILSHQILKFFSNSRL
jgi:hypothetical protein